MVLWVGYNCDGRADYAYIWVTKSAGRLDGRWGEERDLAEYPGLCYCHFQPRAGLIKGKQDGVVRAQNQCSFQS